MRRNNKAQDILEKFHVCPTFFDIRGVTLVRKTLLRILLLPVDFACHKQIPSKGLKSDKYVLWNVKSTRGRVINKQPHAHFCASLEEEQGHRWKMGTFPSVRGLMLRGTTDWIVAELTVKVVLNCRKVTEGAKLYLISRDFKEKWKHDTSADHQLNIYTKQKMKPPIPL